MDPLPRFLLITFLISGWSAYNMIETFSAPENQPSPESRKSKLLFELNELDSPQIRELRYRQGFRTVQNQMVFVRIRLDRLEAEFKEFREKRELRNKMSPEESSGPSSYSAFPSSLDLKKQNKMMEAVRFNITNIYSKIKALREANKLKCSRKKCENINSKVKKTDTYVKFLADVNLTTLDMVLHNISRYTDTVNSLVTNLTGTVTSQKLEIDQASTKLNILARNVYAIMLPNVTANSEFKIKVNNCFADINSADCPPTKLRHGKEKDESVDEVGN